jgi:hypothetical protein
MQIRKKGAWNLKKKFSLLSSFIGEDFFLISSPFFLFLAWRPSWLEVGNTGHNFGRGPSKDHSTKVWLQLAQWFLRRRFVCEFPIGSYVKLSSAVGAILVEGPNGRTHFWKRTIQWLFHQNLVNQDGRQAKNRKKGDEIKKKSSPLKLLSQSQPNLLKWSLGGSLPKLCPTFQTSEQDGRHSRT